MVRIRKTGLIGRSLRASVGPSMMEKFEENGTNLCAVVGNIVGNIVGAICAFSVAAVVVVGMVSLAAWEIYAFTRQIIAPVERPGSAVLLGFIIVAFAVVGSVIALTVWGVGKLLRTETGRILCAWCAAKKAKICPHVEFWHLLIVIPAFVLSGCSGSPEPTPQWDQSSRNPKILELEKNNLELAYLVAILRAGLYQVCPEHFSPRHLDVGQYHISAAMKSARPSYMSADDLLRYNRCAEAAKEMAKEPASTNLLRGGG